MILKIFVLFLSLFPALIWAKSPAPSYDRNKCDSAIGVQKYIVKGSLDDPTPGGKTYSFSRMVGAIKNELLGNTEPNSKTYECLTNLFNKAQQDATNYWVSRISTAGCAPGGDIPSIQPPDCDDDTWQEFHRSMDLIESSAKAVDKAAADCAKNAGNTSACSKAKGTQELHETASAIAARTSDACCDKKTGPAFRVLRSFYTVEFGDLNDTDLQKECYKRTRPNTDTPKGAFIDGLQKCAVGLIKGVFEWFTKTVRSVESLKSLADAGFWQEVGRVFSDRKVLMEKLTLLVDTIMTQMNSQIEAMTSCFSGPYKADQACRLFSSLLLDYKTPAGIVKLLKYLKAPHSLSGKMAQKLIDESPKARAVQANISNAAKTVSSNTSRAYSSVVSVPASVRKVAGDKVRASLTAAGNIRENVAAKLKAMAKKEDGGSAASTKPNPNGRVAADVPDAPPAQTSTPNLASGGPSGAGGGAGSGGGGAARSGSSGGGGSAKSGGAGGGSSGSGAGRGSANRGSSGGGAVDGNSAGLASAKLSKRDRSTAGLKQDLAPFEKRKRLNTNNPEAGLVNSREFARAVKSNDRATMARLLDEGAAKRKAQADLAASRRGKFLSEKDVPGYHAKIDNALNAAKRKYKFDTTPASTTSTAAARTAAVVPDSNMPTGSAPVSGAKAVDSSGAPSAAPPATAQAPGSQAGAPPSAANTSSGVASGAENAASALPSKTDFSPTYSGVDFGSIPRNPALPPAAQGNLAQLQGFVESAQSTFKKYGTDPINMRNSVYGVNSGPIAWTISRKSLRRHRDVEEMLKRGQINPAQANAIHDIIEASERIATNSARATSYSRKYIEAPNAGPSTFRKIAVGTTKSIVGTGTISAMANGQFNRYSDDGRLGNKYDADTERDANKLVDGLIEKPSTIRSEFDLLDDVDEILDLADELRVKIKVAEISLKKTANPSRKKELESLLELLNEERDRALARVDKANEPETPAQAPTSAPTPAPPPASQRP